jgi:hypothetical protein
MCCLLSIFQLRLVIANLFLVVFVHFLASASIFCDLCTFSLLSQFIVSASSFLCNHVKLNNVPIDVTCRVLSESNT